MDSNGSITDEKMLARSNLITVLENILATYRSIRKELEKLPTSELQQRVLAILRLISASRGPEDVTEEQSQPRDLLDTAAPPHGSTHPTRNGSGIGMSNQCETEEFVQNYLRCQRAVTSATQYIKQELLKVPTGEVDQLFVQMRTLIHAARGYRATEVAATPGEDAVGSDAGSVAGSAGGSAGGSAAGFTVGTTVDSTVDSTASRQIADRNLKMQPSARRRKSKNFPVVGLALRRSPRLNAKIERPTEPSISAAWRKTMFQKMETLNEKLHLIESLCILEDLQNVPFEIVFPLIFNILKAIYEAQVLPEQAQHRDPVAPAATRKSSSVVSNEPGPGPSQDEDIERLRQKIVAQGEALHSLMAQAGTNNTDQVLNAAEQHVVEELLKVPACKIRQLLRNIQKVLPNAQVTTDSMPEK